MFGFFRRLRDRFVAHFGVCLAEVGVVCVRPGDVIVVRFKEWLPRDDAMRIQQRLGGVFPGHKVAVFQNGAELIVAGSVPDSAVDQKAEQ